MILKGNARENGQGMVFDADESPGGDHPPDGSTPPPGKREGRPSLKVVK